MGQWIAHAQHDRRSPKAALETDLGDPSDGLLMTDLPGPPFDVDARGWPGLSVAQSASAPGRLSADRHCSGPGAYALRVCLPAWVSETCAIPMCRSQSLSGRCRRSPSRVRSISQRSSRSQVRRRFSRQLRLRVGPRRKPIRRRSSCFEQSRAREWPAPLTCGRSDVPKRPTPSFIPTTLWW